MAEVTHTDKGNGVQMSFYTSLYLLCCWMAGMLDFQYVLPA